MSQLAPKFIEELRQADTDETVPVPAQGWNEVVGANKTMTLRQLLAALRAGNRADHTFEGVTVKQKLTGDADERSSEEVLDELAAAHEATCDLMTAEGLHLFVADTLRLLSHSAAQKHGLQQPEILVEKGMADVLRIITEHWPLPEKRSYKDLHPYLCQLSNLFYEILKNTKPFDRQLDGGWYATVCANEIADGLAGALGTHPVNRRMFEERQPHPLRKNFEKRLPAGLKEIETVPF